MYVTQNGWTRDSMKRAIREKNTGHPARSEGGTCVYQMPNGNRCFVGVFLPDDEDPAFLHQGDARSLLEDYPILRESMPLSDDGLLMLQEVHDSLHLAGTGNTELRQRLAPYAGMSLHDAAAAWIDANVVDGEQ